MEALFYVTNVTVEIKLTKHESRQNSSSTIRMKKHSILVTKTQNTKLPVMDNIGLEYNIQAQISRWIIQ